MIVAANAAAPEGIFGSTSGMIIMMAVLFGAMYFMMIRPQKKEQKRIAAMLADMKIGDAIVTTSGFYGILIDITDEDVIVEFGNNKNCRIPMRRGAIAEVEKAEDAIDNKPSAPVKNAPAKNDTTKNNSTKDNATKNNATKNNSVKNNSAKNGVTKKAPAQNNSVKNNKK